MVTRLPSHSYAYPRALHSFPTRRSSDLSRSGTRNFPKTHPSSLPPSAMTPMRKQQMPFRWRSEEHTSELQSRGHLVCRLLLEKKKNCYQQSVSFLVFIRTTIAVMGLAIV